MCGHGSKYSTQMDILILKKGSKNEFVWSLNEKCFNLAQVREKLIVYLLKRTFLVRFITFMT